MVPAWQANWVDLLLTAILPLSIAIACYLTRGREFRAELTPQSLIVHSPTYLELPFADFQAVQAERPGKRKQFPVHVFHEKGVVSIPRFTTIRSEPLLRALAAKIPDTVIRWLPDELHGIYSKHVNTFSADRVFAYPARQRKIKGFAGRRGMAVSAAIAFSGAIYLLQLTQHNFNNDRSGFVGFGTILCIIGVIFFIAYRSRRELYGGLAKWHHSGLVVSPIGLALIQDKTRGELKWSELVRLTYSTKPPFFLTSASTYSPTHVRLVFSGGVEAVLPLPVIYDKIKQFWGK
jgi:hypothetical protein